MSRKKKIILMIIAAVLILIGLNFFLVPYLTKKEISYLDFEKYNIKSEITQAQIDEAISIKPGKSYEGKVLDKTANDFTLEVYLYNAVNPPSSKYVSFKMPVGPNDEFQRLGRSFGDKNLRMLQTSFDNMKKGDIVAVTVFEDKKTIILPTMF